MANPSISRRAILAATPAALFSLPAVASVPAPEPADEVDRVLHLLGEALQRQHGGTWKIIHWRENGVTFATRWTEGDGIDIDYAELSE